MTVPEKTLISPIGFQILSSNEQWLDNDYESIILRDAVGELIDQTPILIDHADDNCAFTRSPDGDYNWVEMQSSKNAPASFTSCSCSSLQPEIDFRYSGLTEGNISTVEVTPAGRYAKPYNSYLSNIKVGSGELHERTSASEGRYKSEDSMRFRYQKVELFNVTIINWNIHGILAISSWDAQRAINYSGNEINDRDYSSSLFSKEATLFLYNKNFIKNRNFASTKSYLLETGRGPDPLISFIC